MQPIFFGPRSALQANLSKKNQFMVCLLSYSWDLGLGPTGSDPGPFHRTQRMRIQPNLSLQTPLPRIPLYHRTVRLVPGMPKSYIPNFYNTNTSVNRTLGSVPFGARIKEV